MHASTVQLRNSSWLLVWSTQLWHVGNWCVWVAWFATVWGVAHKGVQMGFVIDALAGQCLQQSM